MRREYPAQPIVGVGAVILHRGKLVLVKRGSDPGRSKWSIPGGLVKLGETTMETTIREAKEETGLDIEVKRLVDVVDNIEVDSQGRLRYHFIIVDFLASPKKGILKANSDVVEAMWVPLADAEKYDLTKTLREFLLRNREVLTGLNLAKQSSWLKSV